LCSYGTASKLIFLQAKEDHARAKEALLAKVIFDISMSLDGFITATNVRPEEPLGDGGQRLHEWAFDEDERNRQLLAEAANSEGAVIVGRRTYDLSVAWWGAGGPTGLPGFRCSSSPTPSPKRCPREVCTPS
jgi:dihydrofolate reductase